MQRRAVLRCLLGGAAVVCPICRPAVRAAESIAAQPPHWGYEGEDAPASWGELDPGYRTCGVGAQQSPIDLRDAVKAQLAPLRVSYRRMPLRILNNGHTIQVNAAPGSGLGVDGTRFELLQFHFHHPSEHLVSGRRFEMEAHFVHRSAAGDLAVIGVLIRKGQASAALAPVFQAMPITETPEQSIGGVMVDPAAILPAARGYFRYHGSLTTPPCSEGLHWIVLKTPIEVSAAQLARFGRTFPSNARPVQPRHRRFVLESTDIG